MKLRKKYIGFGLMMRVKCDMFFYKIAHHCFQLSCQNLPKSFAIDRDLPGVRLCFPHLILWWMLQSNPDIIWLDDCVQHVTSRAFAFFCSNAWAKFCFACTQWQIASGFLTYIVFSMKDKQYGIYLCIGLEMFLSYPLEHNFIFSLIFIYSLLWYIKLKDECQAIFKRRINKGFQYKGCK